MTIPLSLKRGADLYKQPDEVCIFCQGGTRHQYIPLGVPVCTCCANRVNHSDVVAAINSRDSHMQAA